jgi:trimeric autotransporter adhesin
VARIIATVHITLSLPCEDQKRQNLWIMKKTTLQLTSPLNRSHLRLAFLLISLACFVLSPLARAVDPPPDGGYPGSNTAEGEDALFSLTTSQGNGNTAVGFQALYSTTSGINNTATGFEALYSCTASGNNTANGALTLHSNTTGSENTAIGAQALYDNTTGDNNTADGVNALIFNTTGHENTAIGAFTLERNTTGFGNIAVGSLAGSNLINGSANIYIGHRGAGRESNTIRIGKQGSQTNTYIAGISGVTVPTGIAVIVDSSGHLGTTTSSERFKDAIKPMDKASEAILALKPVSFRYKKELDPAGIPQFGLVAEQVERVNPDLVARDDQGKPYTVRYEAVNAMLLNEFLKEHRTVQELKSIVAKQETTAAQQRKQIDALTAGLQKVSAQLELSKTVPRRIMNTQ